MWFFFYFDPVYLNTQISWKYNIFINLQNTFSNVIYGVQTDDMNTVSLYKIDFFYWWLDGLCLILRSSLYVQMYWFRQDYCSMFVQLFFCRRMEWKAWKNCPHSWVQVQTPNFYKLFMIPVRLKRLKSD